MPLTASSGYLFGLVPGAAIVLTSATIAACISFFIGRTLLRDWARSKTQGTLCLLHNIVFILSLMFDSVLYVRVQATRCGR